MVIFGRRDEFAIVAIGCEQIDMAVPVEVGQFQPGIAEGGVLFDDGRFLKPSLAAIDEQINSLSRLAHHDENVG